MTSEVNCDIVNATTKERGQNGMRLRAEDSRYVLPELADKIRAIYGSNVKFAKVLKVSPASVSNTLQGKCGFSVEKILLWCRLLNIPTDKWESYFVTTVDRQKVYDHLQGLC